MMDVPVSDVPSFGSRRFERGLRFVHRIHLPRSLGHALGGLAIGAVLMTQNAGLALWIALAGSVLVWPHLAYWVGKHSADPYRAELRSLTLDSAIGGAWIALIHFNLLTSVVLVVMLSMDKLSVGGPKFLARCTLALAGSCAITAVLFGFDVRPNTSMPEILGALPLLVIYPLLVGTTTYNMARQMQYQHRQIETLSRTDGLSQMLTRQAWEDVIGEEFLLCRRSGMPAALLLVSIDHMNRINDWHGYPAGDEVIRSVAAILRHALREHDVAARYSGDKFGALLRNTGANEAHATAERIRERVESAVLEQSGKVLGTVTIGVALVEPKDLGFRDWIYKADRALQAAKGRGGNRIEHFEPIGATPTLA